MPDYRRILDGDRTYYYMHPTKPNKSSDKKKWQVYFKDEKLISSTSWKPDGQKCPETQRSLNETPVRACEGHI